MRIDLHPDNPQPRLIAQISAMVNKGALIAYPTDSCYALGCLIENKDAVDRINRIRQLDKKHLFSLMCSDLSSIATYAKVSNVAYRALKSMTPGAYTFVLPASRSVPKRLHEKRKTIGIRVPDHEVTQALLRALGEPLLSTTLQLPGDEWPMNEPDEVEEKLLNLVDVVVTSGPCELEQTTVLDMSGDGVQVIREGRGELPDFLRH